MADGGVELKGLAALEKLFEPRLQSTEETSVQVVKPKNVSLGWFPDLDALSDIECELLLSAVQRMFYRAALRNKPVWKNRLDALNRRLF